MAVWTRCGCVPVADMVSRLGLGTAPLGNLFTAVTDDEARSVVDAAEDVAVGGRLGAGERVGFLGSRDEDGQPLVTRSRPPRGRQHASWPDPHGPERPTEVVAHELEPIPVHEDDGGSGVRHEVGARRAFDCPRALAGRERQTAKKHGESGD